MQQATLKDAYDLFHRGTITLAIMENNGIRVDVDYLDKKIEETANKIKELETNLRNDKFYKTWRKEFGQKTNLGSHPQLSHVLFDVMGYKYPFEGRELKEKKKLKVQKYKADIETFLTIDDPFVKMWMHCERLKKVNGTYLKGLKNEVVDGFIHPFFNLHTVSTYRSSSDRVNLQNFPIRDPEQGEIIRRCIIPREGYVLVECDYGSLEFNIAACFWQDPEMISYASDPNKDIHRDIAADCFCVPAKEVSKNMRYAAKNQFVFPILYGSYYRNCAPNLWESIEKLKLKTVSGEDIKEVLKRKGIKKLGDCKKGQSAEKGTFEYHIKTVEDNFKKKFHVFATSIDEWWNNYQKTGEFQMMTGFICRGIFSRNFISNGPVQGPGFHCLLESLNLLQAWITKKKMKSLLVGEIHDCAIGDVWLPELQSYLNKIKHIMTKEIPEKWKWIVTPMKVEIDVTPIGGSWHEKAPWVEKEDGLWAPK